MDSSQSSRPYRKGVNAIVIDKDNNFLLVQKNDYKDNEWNFLGGGGEEGETMKQNLFRELNEEMGSERSDFEIVGTSTHKIEYDYPPDTVLRLHGGKYRGQSYDQVILRFVGKKNKLIFTTKEFKAHKWVKAKNLVKHLTFANQYKNHKKAIDELLPGIIK